MPIDTGNLLALQDLEDAGRTQRLTASELNALRAAADWITTFVARPHRDLGRTGPVCPFVPGALERKTLWLAPERIGHQDMPGLVERVSGYKELLLRARTDPSSDAGYQAIVMVFTDLSAARAKEYFGDERLQTLKRTWYADDGVVLGEFHDANDGTAIRNARFKPFKSPVPFLLMRHAVASDWMFFLDDEAWLDSWARRFGDSAVHALAVELRHTNWRQLDLHSNRNHSQISMETHHVNS